MRKVPKNRRRVAIHRMDEHKGHTDSSPLSCARCISELNFAWSDSDVRKDLGEFTEKFLRDVSLVFQVPEAMLTCEAR